MCLCRCRAELDECVRDVRRYGDMVPVESAGMVVAVFTMICGIMVLALPITVLGQNFSDAYSQAQLDKAAHSTSSETLSDTDTRLGNHVSVIKKHRDGMT